MKECKQCGDCCSNIFLPFYADADEERWLKYHDVEYIENNMGTFIKIDIKCSKLKDGLCSIHENRPDICRKYFCEDNKDFIK
jgi:Fe-S-cluster containining protein